MSTVSSRTAQEQTQIEPPTPEELDAAIAMVEGVRAKWHGIPAYARKLDVELFCLRMIRNVGLTDVRAENEKLRTQIAELEAQIDDLCRAETPE